MTIDEPVITYQPERHSKETIQKLLKHLRVTPWTFAIGLVTLVFLVGAVIWYQGYAHDLTTHQPIWWIFALAVVAAYGQYWGYAISLRGASTKPIPKLRTFELEVAESVTYVFTPESIGSLALTVRFLDRQGFTSAEAAGAAGLSSFFTTALDFLIIPIASVFAASSINVSQLKSDSPSSTWEVVGAILLIAAAITLLAKLPRMRKKVIAWSRQAVGYIKTLLHDPQKALVICAGEVATVAGQVTCLSLLMAAFHAPLAIAVCVVITQLAGAASSVVPIPGGLGAPEAILVAGLTAVGLHSETALLVAFSYRILTYWGPPIPGAIALYNLHKKELV